MVSAWVDRHAEDDEIKQMGVEPLSAMDKKEYDCVIIAILNEQVSRKVEADLRKRGIRKKIEVISAKYLLETELPQWVEENV